MYAQNPRENASPKQKIPATILLVFSLAGLIAGFAFGGFTGHKAPPTTSNTGPKTTPTTIARSTVTVTPDPTPENIAPDVPNISKYTYSETADGATSYTVSAQISDKQKKPITTTDVQCRLWFTADSASMETTLSANKKYTLLTNVSDLSQPFPGETAGVTFTAPSTELQPCVASASTTWTYTLATTIQPGTYYLYVLADWKGIHFNWSSVQIKVTA